jgi:dynein heavy chain
MIPIDILNFMFEMQMFYDKESIEEPSDDGCFIHGLYMEGCRWDMEGMILEDSAPAEMFSLAPVILFMPSANYQPEPDEYQMPLYKTTERYGVLTTTGRSTNFIISIECPTNQSPIYWVLKGAAFMCMLND